jgi:hypothetical protein
MKWLQLTAFTFPLGNAIVPGDRGRKVMDPRFLPPEERPKQLRGMLILLVIIIAAIMLRNHFGLPPAVHGL